MLHTALLCTLRKSRVQMGPGIRSSSSTSVCYCLRKLLRAHSSPTNPLHKTYMRDIPGIASRIQVEILTMSKETQDFTHLPEMHVYQVTHTEPYFRPEGEGTTSAPVACRFDCSHRYMNRKSRFQERKERHNEDCSAPPSREAFQLPQSSWTHRSS